jgi:hypothetical protein
MAGLGPAIHETEDCQVRVLVDTRPKAGHERMEEIARWR